MKNYFLIILILISSWVTGQSLDTTFINYNNDTLSVYIEGLLYDADFKQGNGARPNLAISSVHTNTLGDTIEMDIYFLPCGPVIQIIPYDTLIKKELPLASGVKEVVVYAIDTTSASGVAWCPQQPIYLDTAYGQINVPLSTSEPENLLKRINVFPNPTFNLLFIQPKDATELEALKLFDLNGKLVLESQKSVKQLDLSSLTQGVYVLELLSNEGIERIKIYKE